MTEAIKKCEDCKFCEPAEMSGINKLDFATCHHADGQAESDEKWHLGVEGIAFHYCATMRCNSCGKAATLFEPRSATK